MLYSAKRKRMLMCQVSDDEASQIIANAGAAADATENTFATEVSSGSTVRHGTT